MRRVGLVTLKACLMCAGALVLVIWGEVWAGPLNLTVRPNVVRIGTWYNGAKIHVRSHIPQGCQAVIALSGKSGKVKLMGKERRWGMWKNGKEILVQGAPSLYLAMSTDSKLLRRAKGNFSPGYDAIAEQVFFRGADRNMTHGRLFEEFLRLKENRGRYGIFPGRAKILVSTEKQQMVEGVFTLPTHLAQGDYRVAVSVVKDGRVVSQQMRPLKVELAGFSDTIFRLAHQHSLAYGFLAAGIAVSAGFLVGLIFQFFGKPE